MEQQDIEILRYLLSTDPAQKAELYHTLTIEQLARAHAVLTDFMINREKILEML